MWAPRIRWWWKRSCSSSTFFAYIYVHLYTCLTVCLCHNCDCIGKYIRKGEEDLRRLLRVYAWASARETHAKTSAVARGPTCWGPDHVAFFPLSLSPVYSPSFSLFLTFFISRQNSMATLPQHHMDIRPFNFLLIFFFYYILLILFIFLFLFWIFFFFVFFKNLGHSKSVSMLIDTG